MTLFRRTVALSKQSLDRERQLPRKIDVPCHIWLRWPGDMVRGIPWAGDDPGMTGCLECPLTRPVLAQSWCQTATDGTWYSTMVLLSDRDRPLNLCVLRRRGSEPETRWTYQRPLRSCTALEVCQWITYLAGSSSPREIRAGRTGPTTNTLPWPQTALKRCPSGVCAS